MTMMQTALATTTADVLDNVRRGDASDEAKAQAVLLFRLARMVTPDARPEPAVCWRQAVRRLN